MPFEVQLDDNQQVDVKIKNSQISRHALACPSTYELL